jgi:phosphoglycolate phosphatase-like HAD superfamily hydrolase
MVLLFDVDGTLVTTGGAGRRALERIFEVVYGRDDACAFPLDGMTDRAIVRAALRSIGRDAEEAEINAILVRYLEILADEVAGVASDKYRIHRGIEPALEAAAACPNVALGLGTGNIREGARVKLTRVGIYERFAFGGFGGDHEERTELLRVGARRGAERLGTLAENCRVVIVGDTPKDVAAATNLGAESVGVATGRFSTSDLKAAGATFAFADLSEPGALDALLN